MGTKYKKTTERFMGDRVLLKYPIGTKYEGVDKNWYHSYGKSYLFFNEFKRGGSMCSILFFHDKEAFSFPIPMFLIRLLNEAIIWKRGEPRYASKIQQGNLTINEDFWKHLEDNSLIYKNNAI